MNQIIISDATPPSLDSLCVLLVSTSLFFIPVYFSLPGLLFPPIETGGYEMASHLFFFLVDVALTSAHRSPRYISCPTSCIIDRLSLITVSGVTGEPPDGGHRGLTRD